MISISEELTKVMDTLVDDLEDYRDERKQLKEQLEQVNNDIALTKSALKKYEKILEYWNSL